MLNRIYMTTLVISLLACIFLVWECQITGATALEAELAQAKYIVGLMPKPQAQPSETKGARVVEMTSHTGQQFRCTIPDPNYIEPSDEENDTVEEEIIDTDKEEEELKKKAEELEKQKQAALDKFHQQLHHDIKKSFGSGCFTKAVDYWTYDVCPFKHVRQYHKDGDRIGAEFNLGTYSSKSDTYNTLHAPYTQSYISGTNGRQSTVRFICNQEATQDTKTKHLLVSVKEPSTHHYEFEIRTTYACFPEEKYSSESILSSTLSALSSSSSSSSSSASSSSSSSASSAASSAKAKERTKKLLKNMSPSNQVLELLKPMLNECVFLNTGWWTYKLCHLKDISQFHREHQPQAATAGQPATTKMVITNEFSLGRLNADLSMSDLSKYVTVVAGDNWKSTYASIIYTSGTRCDIGDKKERKTEVRYYCDPSEKSVVIKSVSETTTCEYLMIVQSSLLCQHPQFAPSTPKIHEIVCSPLKDIVAHSPHS